jgi:hypothetical protein
MVLFKQPLPKRVRGERNGLRDGKTKKPMRDERMSKISAFIVGTVGLSLAILIPLYLNFQIIETKLQELSILSKVFPNFWQGFALIAIVVIVSIGTLMALLIFGDGEGCVVR